MNGRVEQRGVEMLLVEQGDALGGIAGAVRDVIHVAPLGRGPRVFVAHRAHQAEHAFHGALRSAGR